jgi:lipoprotein-anchoring transpeptidase ErfK/SrfK
LETFFWQERAFGLSSEMDLLPLDRLELIHESRLRGLPLDVEKSLPVAFHVKGAITLWKKNDAGQLIPTAEQHHKRGFYLTGASESGGMIESEGGLWLARSSVRMVEPRDGFPSVATGRRKWIDISTKHQTLVAYEGQVPVYATLISAGRGGLGKEGESNPEGNRTVRGTFMIHEKSVSSTMDGDEDRADSFELKDVPFVQYFHRGFALHGAYWHDEFGKERSHGCINLAPRDSAWLFEWTDPQVPEGWHAALNKTRGTVVYIHP